MRKILITGATGNIGKSVIRYLLLFSQKDTTVIAGLFNLDIEKKKLKEFKGLGFAKIDFEDKLTFQSALSGINTVFLLRPPQLADVKKYFEPFILEMKKQHVQRIVFLSVQGADKSKIIPHNKIERLIVEHDLDHVFIRPGYFMQNLTTTLLSDIKENRKIFLPAAHAKFNWIDVDNIGEVTALSLLHFDDFKNRALELTGSEQLDFYQVAKILSRITGRKIIFQSPGLIRFYFVKKKQGFKRAMIFVMMALHFLPRIQKQPPLTSQYFQITSSQPTTLEEFIIREKDIFSE